MPLIIEYAADSLATADAVWRRYADVASWPTWDAGVRACTLDGPFTAGTTGRLVPADGPAVRFTVSRVEPGRGFADRSALPHPRLPLATLAFEHTLAPLPGGGTRITHRVRAEGLLGTVVARLLGPKLAEGLPVAVRALARLAERDEGRAGAAREMAA